MTLPIERRRDAAYRRDTLWTAAFVHRISGVLLALFLPLHFLALGLAIESEARLDGFLRWTERPLFRLAEAGLVLLLSVHIIGGVRVLLIEAFGWEARGRRVAIAGLLLAIAITGVFLARVL